MSASEERAKAVIEQVKSELPSAWLGGRQHVVLTKAFAAALQAARQAVWEEAAKVAEARFPAYDLAVAATILATLFREQAKKEQP